VAGAAAQETGVVQRRASKKGGRAVARPAVARLPRCLQQRVNNQNASASGTHGQARHMRREVSAAGMRTLVGVRRASRRVQTLQARHDKVSAMSAAGSAVRWCGWCGVWVWCVQCVQGCGGEADQQCPTELPRSAHAVAKRPYQTRNQGRQAVQERGRQCRRHHARRHGI